MGWSMSESVEPEALRLTACGNGATRVIAHSMDPDAQDGMCFVARDEAPELGSMTRESYELKYAARPGTWSTLCRRTIELGSPVTPGAQPLRLHVQPNPFNPAAQVSYALGLPGTARISVYSLTGGLVKVLADGPQTAGSHVLTWDGRDTRGREVPAGSYVIRIDTELGTNAVKVMMVR